MVVFEPRVNRRFERLGYYIAWVITYFVKLRKRVGICCGFQKNIHSWLFNIKLPFIHNKYSSNVTFHLISMMLLY